MKSLDIIDIIMSVMSDFYYIFFRRIILLLLLKKYFITILLLIFMLFSKKKRRDDKSQNVKNKVLNMEYKTIKYQIDELTYLMIDNIIKETCIDDCRLRDTNQAIGLIIEKALNQFILDNQKMLYENFNRRNSLIDEKMKGRKIAFEDVFSSFNIPKMKEGE